MILWQCRNLKAVHEFFYSLISIELFNTWKLGNAYSKHNVIPVMTTHKQQGSSIKQKFRLLLLKQYGFFGAFGERRCSFSLWKPREPWQSISGGVCVFWRYEKPRVKQLFRLLDPIIWEMKWSAPILCVVI